MRLYPECDDLECIVSDDHPVYDVPVTLSLLRAGVDGELDGGPGGGAPVQWRVWYWRAASGIAVALVVDN